MKHKIFRYSLLFGAILIALPVVKNYWKSSQGQALHHHFLQQLMVSRVVLPVFIPVSVDNGLRRYGPSYLMQAQMKVIDRVRLQMCSIGLLIIIPVIKSNTNNYEGFWNTYLLISILQMVYCNMVSMPIYLQPPKPSCWHRQNSCVDFVIIIWLLHLAQFRCTLLSIHLLQRRMHRLHLQTCMRR